LSFEVVDELVDRHVRESGRERLAAKTASTSTAGARGAAAP
jgi:hypothetical protein